MVYPALLPLMRTPRAASSRLNWRPCRFKWTRPFRRKTKSGFCACAITFRTQYTTSPSYGPVLHCYKRILYLPTFYGQILRYLMTPRFDLRGRGGRGGRKNNRNYFFFEWFIRFYTITTLVSFKVLSIWLRSLNLRGSRNLGKITGQISCPQFRLSLLGSLASLRTYRHLAVKVGTSKGRGKQWQTTPKNLPRMQCARAILVTGLGSGSCQPGL